MPIRIDLTRSFTNSTAEPSVTAPTGPFEAGIDVGVPTGTSLTPTVGMPEPDATETYVITHPITLEEVELDVLVWRDRSWSATVTVNPAPGAVHLFENCLFENSADNWCVEVVDTNADTPFSAMSPLAIFDRCTFDGNDSCARGILAGFTWLIDCHVANAEDAFSGAYYSVAIGCNLIASTDGGEDPHQDGVQVAGLGRLTLYRCWVSAGEDPGANAAVRVGTEFSAVDDIAVHYCGLDDGGYTMQMRGDSGGGDITGVSVVGCRWVDNAAFGPVDFVEATVAEWSDNAFIGGESINNPAP